MYYGEETSSTCISELLGPQMQATVQKMMRAQRSVQDERGGGRSCSSTDFGIAILGHVVDCS